jgi:hypothetical protein
LIREKLKKKWLTHAITGLMLNGLGLSLLGEAILQKSTGESFLWIFTGTVALSLINAGISYVGTAVKYRVHLDNAIEYKRTRNRKGPGE